MRLAPIAKPHNYTGSSMRRRVLHVVIALTGLLALPAQASAHAAFLGSTPAPGARLAQSAEQLQLRFTETLNDRLSRVRLTALSTGKDVEATSRADGRRLTLSVQRPLPRGAYRVTWHTVSVDEGHALDGTFSFGVRAPAAGGRQDVEQSPFARGGPVRMAARVLLYSTLLLFSGCLLLEAVLRRSRDGSWLTPEGLADPDLRDDVAAVGDRHRQVILNAGCAAVAAAALSATADAADAAGGFSARGLSSFLLHASAGLSRLAVVGLLMLALAAAALRLRAAVVPALAALAALAVSGHANASSPRAVALFTDWLHLASAATWVGGVSLIVLAWGPRLRAASRPQRVQVAREVLPAFGQVALPAFLVVVVTGLISAAIELGSVAASWQTAYGRVLLIKSAVVVSMAAAGHLHARRLRPRLLDASRVTPDRLERRHWRLLGAEPLLGIGVITAVAVLVAFPLPPRQLELAAQARASAEPTCAPCPLATPGPDELAVAEQAGSDVVAAWMRRNQGGLVGTVRVFGLDRRPRDRPVRVPGASTASCGVGCVRFRQPVGRPTLDVTVAERGATYVARLPTRWQAGGSARARRLLEQAQKTMRGLRSVREIERVSSVPGLQATTRYVLAAPDRMTFRTDLGVRSVVIGGAQWRRESDLGYRRTQYGGGLPFRTRSWFTWTTYAQRTYYLRRQREGENDVDVIALMDAGTPAWWQLHIDRRTRRVLHDRLITYGHFAAQQYTGFNTPVTVKPPVLEP